MSSLEVRANKLRLTKKAVEGLISRRDGSGPRRYWDTDLPGLYLQFTPGGVASYLVRYTKPSGAKGDFTIGRAALIGPDQARDAAKEKLAQLVLNGEDPVEARAAKRETARNASERTVATIARRYVEARKKQRPEGASYLDEWVIETYILPKIGRFQISAVTRQMAIDLVRDTQAVVVRRNQGHEQERQGKVTANRVHGALRRMYEWALNSEYVDRNPAAFKRMFTSKPTKRKGAMTDERFALIWQELEAKAQIKRQASPLAIQLYMLTLQRPIDIARARREHFDFSSLEWRIPWTLTKTGEPYLIPLTAEVVELVQEAFARTDSDYLFPAQAGFGPHLAPGSMNVRFKKAIADLQDAGRWPDGPRAQLYDCRRFGRTQIVHKLGFPKDVAERVINHAEGSGIDQLYDVHDYTDDLRKAHVAWGGEVMRLISRRDGQ